MKIFFDYKEITVQELKKIWAHLRCSGGTSEELVLDDISKDGDLYFVKADFSEYE